MKLTLAVCIGLALGCLATLALHLPWLPPLDNNVTNVTAALASSVLAVAGAFALWLLQTSKKRKALTPIAASVFQKLYEALELLRQSIEETTARALLVRAGGTDELRPEQVWEFQYKTVPRALDVALVEAKTAIEHWAGIQEVVLSVDPKHLADFLELYRIARGAENRLPPLKEKATPIFLDWQPLRIDAEDRQLLSLGIATLAKSLNALDGGARDTAALDEMAPTMDALLQPLKGRA